jgi:hypothetical protein
MCASPQDIRARGAIRGVGSRTLKLGAEKRGSSAELDASRVGIRLHEKGFRFVRTVGTTLRGVIAWWPALAF